MDLLPRLLNATSEVKAIYLEDVYLTGRTGTCLDNAQFNHQVSTLSALSLAGLLREHVGGKIVYLKEFIRYHYFEPTHCISFASFSYHKIPADVQKDLFANYASDNSENVSTICSFFTIFN